MLPDVKSCHVVIFTKSETCYLLHFCHACLNLLMSELAVAQCSSFVKHHEWILAMFECCSIFILLHLDGYLLFIAGRCHICFACHFQTVHPIPVIFIFILTEINSSFQWHSWISKLRQIQSFLSKSCICTAYRIPHIMPCSSFSFRSTHRHRISYLAYHTCFASCCLRISRC